MKKLLNIHIGLKLFAIDGVDETFGWEAHWFSCLHDAREHHHIPEGRLIVASRGNESRRMHSILERRGLAIWDQDRIHEPKERIRMSDRLGSAFVDSFVFIVFTLLSFEQRWLNLKIRHGIHTVQRRDRRERIRLEHSQIEGIGHLSLKTLLVTNGIDLFLRDRLRQVTGQLNKRDTR